MRTIVVISGDRRAGLLKDRFQPLMTAQISVDTDYEHGLKAVFDKRPALVFIQGEIGGVSGGAVAKQIKGLLRDAAPRIVLMGDAVTLKEKARSWYDDSFDFSAPDDELFTQFRAQVEKHLPDVWREEPNPSEIDGLQIGSRWDTVQQVEPAPAAGPAPDLSPAALPAVEPLPLHAPGPGSSGRKPAQEPPVEPVRKKPAAVPPPEKVRTPTPSMPVSPAPRAADFKPASDRQPTRQDAGRPLDGPAPKARELPPIEFHLPQRPSPHRTLWPYGAGLLAALLLAALVYWFTAPRPSASPKPSTSPAPRTATPRQTPPSPPPPARIARLPEMVPVAGKDSGYGAKHPGWSRYVGNGMEYKLFTDNGEIKAIQVMASGSRPIPDDTPSRLLSQLFGYASYSTASSVEKRNYLVQTAGLPGRAEMLIYRKKGVGEIRGIVLTVP